MNANQILQRGGGIVRGSFRIPEQVTRRLGSEALGLVRRARRIGTSPKPKMDDVTLTRKVETEIFRGTRAPKSRVNVNVVDGVVWLRGELKRPEQIRNLERKARSIPEVRGVENLLHLAKTPAPTRADAPRRQQRTRSSTRRPTPRRSGRGRVSGDKTTALVPQAEPSPAERAEHGEGRSPAPFGASEPHAPASSSAIEETAPASSSAIEETAPASSGTGEERAPATFSAGQEGAPASSGTGEERAPASFSAGEGASNGGDTGAA